MVIKEEPRIYKVYEVVKQAKPSLLFPDEPVSKRKSFAGIRCGTEREARSRIVEDEYYKYEVRERVFRFVRKSGFDRDGIFHHDIEVRETISLKTLS
ncbi:hypothetical protein ES708_27382 [subsurface metagenome]